MPLTLRVHQYRAHEGREVLSQVVPYVRMVKKDEPVYVLQDGCVYGQGGGLIEPADVPEWVWDTLAGMSPTVRDELKVRRPGGKAHESTKKAT